MKQKDIALILVVVVFSGVVSLVVSKLVIATPTSRQEKVDVVEPIVGEFKTLSDKYFNKDSVDPTLNIIIGQNSNDQPFNKQP